MSAASWGEDAPRTGPRRPQASLAHLGDDGLLDLARHGEPTAQAELYLRHGAEVRRFARSLVPAHEVDDVVSESFAKMLQALRRGRGPTHHPIRYLMVTVRTTAATHWAAAARTVPSADVPVDRTAAADELVLRDEDLVAAFRSLRQRWREVIWWTTIDGCSPAEVGQRLGVSAAAASAMSYRARRALRAAYLARLAGHHSED